MPSEPKPKKFVAAAPFTYRHRTYKAGEPVEDRRSIDNLLRYGDRFIIAKRSKSASAETSAVDTANPNSAESKKED
jgi:hypothetical protein